MITEQDRQFLLDHASPEPNSGCWLWEGAIKTHPSGYQYGNVAVGRGALNWKARPTWLAHRASYVAFVGDIPEGLSVLHKCDNPACINPEHLWVGTLKDNMADMRRKGRAGWDYDRRGENNPFFGKHHATHSIQKALLTKIRKNQIANPEESMAKFYEGRVFRS